MSDLKIVKRKDMISQQARIRIMELFNAGHSLSAISRLTMKSYKHVKQIVEQETALQENKP